MNNIPVTNTEVLSADARNRALRTFLQNIGIDVLVAVVAILIPFFQDANSFGELEWKIILFSLAKTIALTVFAFIMRRFLDRSAFPTPLPPVTAGTPNDNTL